LRIWYGPLVGCSVKWVDELGFWKGTRTCAPLVLLERLQCAGLAHQLLLPTLATFKLIKLRIFRLYLNSTHSTSHNNHQNVYQVPPPRSESALSSNSTFHNRAPRNARRLLPSTSFSMDLPMYFSPLPQSPLSLTLLRCRSKSNLRHKPHTLATQWRLRSSRPSPPMDLRFHESRDRHRLSNFQPKHHYPTP
jgi:hypothetical protein